MSSEAALAEVPAPLKTTSRPATLERLSAEASCEVRLLSLRLLIMNGVLSTEAVTVASSVVAPAAASRWVVDFGIVTRAAIVLPATEPGTEVRSFCMSAAGVTPATLLLPENP